MITHSIFFIFEEIYRFNEQEAYLLIVYRRLTCKCPVQTAISRRCNVREPFTTEVKVCNTYDNEMFLARCRNRLYERILAGIDNPENRLPLCQTS